MSQDTKKKGVDLKRYRIKKLIETLKEKRGFHTELISLYIPPDKKVSDITNYLKNEISESQNIKSKLTRKNVLDSISSLLGQLKNIREVPEEGLIMFSGAIPQNDTPGTEKNELYLVQPPDVVTIFKYHCDSEFLLWPLEEMLAPKATYGLIVVGRQESAVGYVRGNKVEVVREFSSGLHGKHRAGGQSQRRFERLIEEGEKRFYRRISDEINRLFLSMEDLRGIFIGGPGPSKEKFVNDESLDYRLREKILDVVDLGYGGSEGIRALLERVKENIKDIKYIEEKEIMQKFMKEITSDAGLAAYGIKEVEKALNYGAVDTLIVSEKLDLIRTKLQCSNCGYEGEKIIKENEFEAFESSIQNDTCPECQSSTYSLESYDSVIESFGAMAESTGSDIEIISTETEEGETLYSTFGGIVAMLRYKVSY
ncbi:MAG: peptide chain release factor 1 [Candidatus Lokiarchaeota archaeon]|nr:peptide chain release factor 1 [Candidatus Lokiarchaeota archaeon]MBD3201354.1 peptide chain release factor 1 [Candidatus Lokiarchaeota archaeon]